MPRRLDGEIIQAEGSDIYEPSYEGAQLFRRAEDWVRSVRGTVLAGTFATESKLDVLITNFLFNELASPGNAQSDLFMSSILSQLSLERKIRTATEITGLVYPDAVDRLARGLGRMKEVRNAIAHHGCWFVYNMTGASLTSIEARIDISGKETTLDPNLTASWSQMFMFLAVQLSTLANYILHAEADLYPLSKDAVEFSHYKP